MGNNNNQLGGGTNHTWAGVGGGATSGGNPWPGCDLEYYIHVYVTSPVSYWQRHALDHKKTDTQ